MKKLTLLFLITLHYSLLTVSSSAQSCLPEGITFTTQAEIDNFQTNYPNCTEIEGDVRVGGWEDNITNLNGLSVLTTIQGNLEINSTNYLETLTGLDNLTSVGGNVTIGAYGVDAMLAHVQCEGNSSLIALTGLDNLTSIGGNLDIYCNENLTSLMGLGNLTTINGDVNIGHAHTLWLLGDVTSAGNQLITTLSGLGNVGYIGGDLIIEGNFALTTLSGLNNEIIIGGDLSIKYNETLSTCEAQSICNYLVKPNGAVEIHSNSEGCNDPVEVANNCGFTLSCLPYGNYYFLNQIDIDEFQINFPLCDEVNGDVYIYGSDITNLNGLSSISSIDGDLRIGRNVVGINPFLTSLSGLEGLTSIGRCLSVIYNDSLVNIDGLENIDAASITELRIVNNHNLAICEVKSICDYLAAPNGNIKIDNNSSGCNSPGEVIQACAQSVDELSIFNNLSIHPNPFTNTITIEFDLKQPEILAIAIYNYLGEELEVIRQRKSVGHQMIEWDCEELPAGIYFCVLKTNSAHAGQTLKLIKL